MSDNSNLRRAMKAKQDEFYTQKDDIENELLSGGYQKHFKDKIVYCNCDDPCDGPMASEFWKFFVRNFNDWKLKKLIATHYEPDSKNFSYKIETGPDKNGQFNMFADGKPKKQRIKSNGDFRSASCVRLLKQSDIVVTNPPFSLFREYVAQLIKYDKKFVIIGNVNCITYKEIFPLIQNNKLWLGVSIHSGDRKFYVPEYYQIRTTNSGVEDNGRRFVRVSGVRWFTNLDIPRRHVPIDLRGNYYYGNEDKYPKYDNYDAIEVSKVDDIPIDYNGVMGVPITFLDKYCPEQFEIVGMGTGDNAKEIGITKNYRGRTDLSLTRPDGVHTCPYQRILIRRKDINYNEN